MKKILLLFTQESVAQGRAEPGALASLLEEANPALKVDWSFYEDLIHIISKQRVAVVDSVKNIDIADYDFVYHRRWQEQPAVALACAIYLKSQNKLQVDHETYLPSSLSKLTQYWRFYENNLPFPDTVYIPAGIKLEKARNYIKKFGFPLVIKAANGTRGEANYLVNDEPTLEKLLKDSDEQYIVQRFIPNDGDYRIVTMGRKPELIIYRKAHEGAYLNNVSQGAAYKRVGLSALPDIVLEDAAKAATILARDIAGVDVVIDNITNQHYLFEVNRSPQIENAALADEKAKLLTDYFLERLANN